MRGHGAPGVNGGPAGDLYITFVIPDDPVFKRLGNDLYIDAPLSLYTAVLGGEETVDTLNGKVKLKVKPETQNGTKVRLKGKGFPVYKEEGKFGDLIVTYNVTIPSNLTEHQKELFRQLKIVAIKKRRRIMQSDLIIINDFCDRCHVDPSFITELEEDGLIEVRVGLTRNATSPHPN